VNAGDPLLGSGRLKQGDAGAVRWPQPLLSGAAGATERPHAQGPRDSPPEVLALRRTHGEVAQRLNVGLGGVPRVEQRAPTAGLRRTDVEGLADESGTCQVRVASA
jgi:hypothetical protein